MKLLRNNLLSLVTLAAMGLLSVIVYSDLPSELPSSFSWSGEIRGTLPKAIVAALTPAMTTIRLAKVSRYRAPGPKAGSPLFAATLLTASTDTP